MHSYSSNNYNYTFITCAYYDQLKENNSAKARMVGTIWEHPYYISNNFFVYLSAYN